MTARLKNNVGVVYWRINTPLGFEKKHCGAAPMNGNQYTFANFSSTKQLRCIWGNISDNNAIENIYIYSLSNINKNAVLGVAKLLDDVSMLSYLRLLDKACWSVSILRRKNQLCQLLVTRSIRMTELTIFPVRNQRQQQCNWQRK